jgi:hypothetical protein
MSLTVGAGVAPDKQPPVRHSPGKHEPGNQDETCADVRRRIPESRRREELENPGIIHVEHCGVVIEQFSRRRTGLAQSQTGMKPLGTEQRP